MTNQKTAVWEKRQMGNVLLIIILGIKMFLAEAADAATSGVEWSGLLVSKLFQIVLASPASKSSIFLPQSTYLFGVSPNKSEVCSKMISKTRCIRSFKNKPKHLLRTQKVQNRCARSRPIV